LIVGIDVHKHTHAVALIDERGGEIATFTIANSPKGYRRLIDWLVDQNAADAVVGVESPAAMAAASSEPSPAPASRCCRCRPGARIASAIAADQARPITATPCRSRTSF
jgi:hypothetical protein